MRPKTYLANLLATLNFVSFCLQPGFADPPDLLRSYRFVPRLSTLHQTGGFAGFDFRLPIFGDYDFITGYRGGEGPIPSLDPYAQFANVAAQAGHPASASIFPAVDIDQALNLSGLDGKPIFHGPDGLTVYHFSGDDGSGDFPAKVNLHVATLGRWMFMRGGTTPPCCDFFQYDIKAISRQNPYGDFDGDGDVGAADLATWQTGLDEAGKSLSGRDFLTWQRSYGEIAPSIGDFDAMLDAALVASSSSVLSSIPEPASLVLLVGFAVCLGTGRRFS
ncbi:hypothetical protein [Bythopirellula polymerisocia]|uniref:PEP-CTERM protein-sorting domain-containing protein n=1 Tax=Bythopirellula polymerisocia TaxID=2528003 RepID=A0A5C6D5M5_9BACT|nr:hypothetical protein [Bythopirellula polymerisocia]TWU30199.1 hypothetical protein Pla144_09850 [Bythopirellula polymerisocia]